eukprot:g1407.t1
MPLAWRRFQNFATSHIESAQSRERAKRTRRNKKKKRKDVSEQSPKTPKKTVAHPQPIFESFEAMGQHIISVCNEENFESVDLSVLKDACKDLKTSSNLIFDSPNNKNGGKYTPKRPHTNNGTVSKKGTFPMHKRTLSKPHTSGQPKGPPKGKSTTISIEKAKIQQPTPKTALSLPKKKGSSKKQPSSKKVQKSSTSKSKSPRRPRKPPSVTKMQIRNQGKAFTSPKTNQIKNENEVALSKGSPKSDTSSPKYRKTNSPKPNTRLLKVKKKKKNKMGSFYRRKQKRTNQLIQGIVEEILSNVFRSIRYIDAAPTRETPKSSTSTALNETVQKKPHDKNETETLVNDSQIDKDKQNTNGGADQKKIDNVEKRLEQVIKQEESDTAEKQEYEWDFEDTNIITEAEAATLIQRQQRKRIASKEFQEKRECATKLQGLHRGRQVRKQIEEEKQAAIKLQSLQRSRMAVKQIEEEKDAAIKLQSLQRSRMAQKQLAEQKDAAIKLQSVQRGRITRHEMQKSHQAASKVQNLLRKRQQCKNFQLSIIAVQNIQRIVRGHLGRRDFQQLQNENKLSAAPTTKAGECGWYMDNACTYGYYIIDEESNLFDSKTNTRMKKVLSMKDYTTGKTVASRGLIVEGCGVESINGIYWRRSNHHYRKSSQNSPETYEISRREKDAKGKKGLDSFPPMYDWKNCGTNKFLCSPTIRKLIGPSRSWYISGCGLECINGEYIACSGREDNTKYKKVDGSQRGQMLTRIEHKGTSMWTIMYMNDRLKNVCAYANVHDGEMVTPPLSISAQIGKQPNWRVLKNGEHPTPCIEKKTKEDIDSIFYRLPKPTLPKTDSETEWFLQTTSSGILHLVRDHKLQGRDEFEIASPPKAQKKSLIDFTIAE